MNDATAVPTICKCGHSTDHHSSKAPHGCLICGCAMFYPELHDASYSQKVKEVLQESAELVQNIGAIELWQKIQDLLSTPSPVASKPQMMKQESSSASVKATGQKLTRAEKITRYFDEHGHVPAGLFPVERKPLETMDTTGQNDLFVILDEIEARAEKATAGPWKKCSASEGKCKCHDIWSIPADSPVCSCNDKWGDTFASLRFVNGDKAGSIGAKAEAYEDMIEYGDIGEEAKQANKDFIAASRTDVPALVKALREATGTLKAMAAFVGEETSWAGKTIAEMTAILTGSDTNSGEKEV